jgi:hypothetical protein
MYIKVCTATLILMRNSPCNRYFTCALLNCVMSLKHDLLHKDLSMR